MPSCGAEETHLFFSHETIDAVVRAFGPSQVDETAVFAGAGGGGRRRGRGAPRLGGGPPARSST